MDSLKLFVLKDGACDGLHNVRHSMAIADNKNNAIPDLFIHDPQQLFFKPVIIKRLINDFFWTYGPEMFDETRESFLSRWCREDRIKMAKYTLNYWGMECEDIDLETIFVLEPDSSEEALSVIASEESKNVPFYKRFLKLPREKQIQLGKLFIKESDFYIESYPITSIPGIEKVTQNAEDKMNEMRLDVLKVMRRNVPEELIDMCIGKYLK